MASIISGLFIMLALLFMAPLFYHLPDATLGAIVLVAVSGLFDAKEMIHIWRVKRRDVLPIAATMVATLVSGIELGIGVGFAISISSVIQRSAYPHTAVLGQLPGTETYRNVKRFENAVIKRGIEIIRFDASLYFANHGFLQNKIRALATASAAPTTVVILNANGINDIDSTAAPAFARFVKTLRASTTKPAYLLIAEVKGPVREVMDKGGVSASIAIDVGHLQSSGYFTTLTEAVVFAEQLLMSGLPVIPSTPQERHPSDADLFQ
jgi:SulP family sulfate permease